MPTNRKCRVAFRLAYLHLILFHSEDQDQVHGQGQDQDQDQGQGQGQGQDQDQDQDQGQGHEHFDYKSKVVTYKSNNFIAIKYKVACGIRLAYLDLTLAYSEGQLDRMNGVSSNFFAYYAIKKNLNIIHSINFFTYLLSLVNVRTIKQSLCIKIS